MPLFRKTAISINRVQITSGTRAGDLLLDKRRARDVAVIALLLFVGLSSRTYSFNNNIPALRRLWAYPLFGLINLLLLRLGLRAWRANIGVAPSLMRDLLFLELAWGGVLILRSVDPTPTGIRDLFFFNWSAMSFLAPFLALCGLRARFWPLFCKYGAYFLAIGIICVGLMDFLLMAGRGVGNPFCDRTILSIAPLFFLGGFQLSNKYIYWGTLGLLVWFLFEFFSDGRENMVLIGWYFFCSLFLMSRSRVLLLKDKVRMVIVLGLCAALLSVVGVKRVYRAIGTDSLDRRVAEFFLEGGAARDTRKGIYGPFFADLSLTDVIWGRGAVTSYEVGDKDLAAPFLKGLRRRHIEVGHLYHLLTGGLIQVVLFNSIALGAVYLGLRRSRNVFTYCLAFIVLGWVLLMLTAGIPFMTPRYLLVWLAIGGCWSRELRSMTTDDFVGMWHANVSQESNC